MDTTVLALALTLTDLFRALVLVVPATLAVIVLKLWSGDGKERD